MRRGRRLKQEDRKAEAILTQPGMTDCFEPHDDRFTSCYEETPYLHPFRRSDNFCSWLGHYCVLSLGISCVGDTSPAAKFRIHRGFNAVCDWFGGCPDRLAHAAPLEHEILRDYAELQSLFTALALGKMGAFFWPSVPAMGVGVLAFFLSRRSIRELLLHVLDLPAEHSRRGVEIATRFETFGTPWQDNPAHLGR